MLQTKNLGDTVLGGSMNCGNALHVQVTRMPAESTLQEIAHLVEEAQGRYSIINYSSFRITTASRKYSNWLIRSLVFLHHSSYLWHCWFGLFGLQRS